MDSEAWNARYGQSELVWSAGPNQTVAEHAGPLPVGRALDVACGEGRNATWLAEQGWEVVGIDYSDVAIDKARAIAQRRSVDVDFRVGDVLDPTVVDDLGDQFDLVVFAYLQLPADQLAMAISNVISVIAGGGTVLFVGHHLDNLERGYGGPQDPGVLHDPARIAPQFVGFDISRAGEIKRVVQTESGEKTAVDALVVATRPV